MLRPEWSAPANIRAFVTTRQGGVSQREFASLNIAEHVGDDSARVAQNRRQIADEFPETTQWQWLNQVHGAQIHKAIHKAGELPQVLEGDGLVTKEKGLVCCVMTADCLPVLFASRSGDEVAIAHGGWRGLAAGILTSTVDAMDCPPSDMVVWLGPAIGPCHFEVGPEVREVFLTLAVSEDMDNQFTPVGEKYLADLYGIAELQLRALGVESISASRMCTYSDAEKFYSYRRDGRTGRMLSAIYIS